MSLRTASRVLNDDPRVAPVTRQRVREAMAELRFEPDAMARSLRAGTDTAVGFVVESIADPFFADGHRRRGGGDVASRPVRARHEHPA